MIALWLKWFTAEKVAKGCWLTTKVDENFHFNSVGGRGFAGGGLLKSGASG